MFQISGSTVLVIKSFISTIAFGEVFSPSSSDNEMNFQKTNRHW